LYSIFDLALNVQYLLLKENQSKEDTMVQYLELVLKRDLAAGWRHTVEKVGLFFEKTSEVDPKEKTEELDWRDRSGKNWYY
jgi:hypothetical protein